MLAQAPTLFPIELCCTSLFPGSASPAVALCQAGIAAPVDERLLLLQIVHAYSEHCQGILEKRDTCCLLMANEHQDGSFTLDESSSCFERAGGLQDLLLSSALLLQKTVTLCLSRMDSLLQQPLFFQSCVYSCAGASRLKLGTLVNKPGCEALFFSAQLLQLALTQEDSLLIMPFRDFEVEGCQCS